MQDHPFRMPDTERYREGPVLGWGGMGQVLASSDRRLNREVAYKRVAMRATGSGASGRLAREAWITAHLEHPGIVPVYDAGVSEDGHLFYTMRLVRGRTLSAALSEAGDLAARIRLLRHVLDTCQAVAYAHSVGVVHRDLKPANVMVGSFGETQVVDWGLATVPSEADKQQWKALGLPGGPGDGDHGERWVGTPAYMSPEQARGEPIDARSDVWSLGAVIYEVLTGTPPHLGGDTDALLQRARRGTVQPVRTREPEAPAELAAIAERALSEAPDDRYADAGELARELTRWLDGRLVKAYAYTPLDLLRRFVVAWRAPLIVAAAAAVALVGLGTWTWNRTVQERNRARQAETSALEALARADESLARALAGRAWVHADAGSRPEAEVLAVRSLALRDSPEARGVLSAFAAQPRVTRRGEVALPKCTQRVLNDTASQLACIDVDRLSMWDLPDTGQAVQRWEARLPAVESVLMPPGRTSVLVMAGEQLHFLDGESGRILATKSDPTTLWAVSFSPDEATSRPIGGQDDRLVQVDLDTRETRLWNQVCSSGDILARVVRAPDGRTAAMCRNTGARYWEGDLDENPRRIGSSFTGHHTASAMAWMPDGERIVVGSIRGGVGLLDLATGRESPMAISDGGGVQAVVPSPDGAWVAVVTERTGVQLWAPATGTFVGRLPAGARRAARWTAAGELATVSRDRLERWVVPAEAGPVRYDIGVGLSGAEPSPDGTALAIARADNRVEVREVATGERLMLDGHREEQGFGVCKRTAWTPDGNTVLAGCMLEAGARRYDARTWTAKRPVVPPAHSLRRLEVLRPSLLVALDYGASGPLLVDLQTDQHLPAIAEGSFKDAQASRNRDAAVLLGREGDIQVIRGGERPSRTLRTTEPLGTAVAIDERAERIAVLRQDDVRILGPDGETELIVDHREAPPTDVVLTSAGDRLITGGRDGVARVFDLPSGRLIARLQGHTERVATIALSQDETTLFTTSWDGTVRRWGLGVIDAPVSQLAEEIHGAWDLDLDEALGGR